MSNRFEQLSDVLSGLSDSVDTSVDVGENEGADTFEFWVGASGRSYVHSVYSLVDCPELPKVNYILAHRDDMGECDVLHIGQTSAQARSLNRAAIRQIASQIGANEVHVHYLGTNRSDRAVIAFDIDSALEMADDEFVGQPN
ncbi:MAG: hypothetical protein AAF732_08700 [Pseudomonadota bacterium]